MNYLNSKDLTLKSVLTYVKRALQGVFLAVILIPIFSLRAYPEDDIFRNRFLWEEVSPLPPGINAKKQPGLAAPFAGSHNGVIIVAGGSNFPDAPVFAGGIKKYYNDIFVYDPEEDQWIVGSKFPYPVAYGASVSLDKGVVCIGGNNLDQSFAKVFLVKWNSNKKNIEIQRWPSLPNRMTSMAAALVGNTIYVAGGTSDGRLANTFLSLDLTMIDKEEFKWEVHKDFPGPARIQPVAVGQNDAEEPHFYLFSGSSFPDGDEKPTLTTNGLEYNPITEVWSEISDIQPRGGGLQSLHGGSGMPIGTHHILFVGGVNREIFHDAWILERKYTKAKIVGDSVLTEKLGEELYNYFLHPSEWYKFNKDILVYHTITDTWTIVDEYPFAGPAGAPIVNTEDYLYVISGEIKPGVRSPNVYRAREEAETRFGMINWILLTIYLAGMLYLGYFFMKRENSTEDFFKGGERVPWWAAGMSIFATMLSAITFMAIPAKTYTTDWRYFMMAITIFVVAIPVVKYYLPFFRRLKVTSAYEYLEKRFNSLSRLLASAIFIVFMVARTALVLFLPSLALTTVTGIDIFTCIILMGVITIIYCTMGGVEAVIWGDVIQGFVLMGGAFLAVIFLISGTEGGLNKLIDITIEYEKMKTFNMVFSFTSATFWVVLLGGLANNLISYSSDQTVIQRYLTTKDEKSAGKSILMNGILSILVSVIFYFIGTALFAFYKTNPSQLNISMANPDSIFPYFIMTKMPQGIAGIMIAAIFAATMSTVSSSINSLSTAFTTDFYRKMVKNRTDGHYLSMARLAGILLGGISVGLAILMAMWNILSLFDYFNYILGLLASGLGGLFFMGIFIPRIRGIAAITGFAGGLLTVFIVKMQTDIHLMLYGFIGMSSSIIIGILASYIIPEKPKNLEELTIKSLRKNYGL